MIFYFSITNEPERKFKKIQEKERFANDFQKYLITNVGLT